jgi:outer membrane protein TolC
MSRTRFELGGNALLEAVEQRTREIHRLREELEQARRDRARAYEALMRLLDLIETHVSPGSALQDALDDAQAILEDGAT